MAREGERLAAGARRLLEHLAEDGHSGPVEGPDGTPAERFHLTAEGMEVIAQQARA